MRWYTKICLASFCVFGISLGQPPAAFAQSCENFVGGVCLDKKKSPAKKKKVRKKRVKQKAAPKKPVVKKVSAPQCISMEVKTTGNANQASVSSTRQSQVVLRNTCAQTVVSYVALNKCSNPVVYFDGSVRSSQRTFEVRGKKRKSFVVTRPQNLTDPNKIVRINHVFKGKSGAYPRWGC